MTLHSYHNIHIQPFLPLQGNRHNLHMTGATHQSNIVRENNLDILPLKTRHTQLKSDLGTHSSVRMTPPSSHHSHSCIVYVGSLCMMYMKRCLQTKHTCQLRRRNIHWPTYVLLLHYHTFLQGNNDTLHSFW